MKSTCQIKEHLELEQYLKLFLPFIRLDAPACSQYKVNLVLAIQGESCIGQKYFVFLEKNMKSLTPCNGKPCGSQYSVCLDLVGENRLENVRKIANTVQGNRYLYFRFQCGTQIIRGMMIEINRADVWYVFMRASIYFSKTMLLSEYTIIPIFMYEYFESR